jgi:hypothetical protein
MFSYRNDTDLGYDRVIVKCANGKRGRTSQNDLIYRVETRRKLEAAPLRMFHCIVITRFSSLRGRTVSKLYHNPMTIDSFVFSNPAADDTSQDESQCLCEQDEQNRLVPKTQVVPSHRLAGQDCHQVGTGFDLLLINVLILE